jgi:hypothetical protein
MNDAELKAKVIQAMELRGTGYFIDAVKDIIAAHERKPLTELERRQAREARNAELLEIMGLRPVDVVAVRPLVQAA